MRRMVFGTVLAWVAGATCVLAQGGRPPVSPYSPYASNSAHDDAAAYEDPAPPPIRRVQTNPAPTGPVMLNGQSVPGPVMTGSGPGMWGPSPRVNSGMGCANGNCGDPTGYGDCGQCNSCGDCGGWNPRCPCGPCGPAGCMWVNAEYLLWWAKGGPLPPLVTASPAGTPQNLAGVLGAPGTSIVFGNSDFADGVRSGFRVRAGFWIDECNMCGFDGGLWFLGPHDETHVLSCDAAHAMLARPFFNALTATQDSELVCFPNVLSGTVTVQTRNDFYGADANFRTNLCCGCNFRFDALFGYRFMSLNEQINIDEDLTDINPSNTTPDGTRIQVHDLFRAENRFHGAQVGFVSEFRHGKMFIETRGTVAMGPVIQTATIAGSTEITTPGSPTTVSTGGLLAQTTNIGTVTRTRFAVAPEVGVNIGAQVTDHVRLYVGYSFLYWSNVVRPGNLIDLGVNPNLLPPAQPGGPNRPAFQWNENSFWAQGITFGVQFRY